MKTSLLFAFLLLSTFKSFCQLEMGQSKNKAVIFLQVLEQNNPRWLFNEKYGKYGLNEIEVKKYNAMYYDLKLRTDAILHFIFEEGTYSYRTTEFPHLSAEFVKGKFDEFYGNTKIGDYYFVENYQYFNHIRSEGNHAVVYFRKTALEQLPTAVTKELDKRKDEMESNQKQQEKAAIDFHYINQYHDIEEFKAGYTQKAFPEIVKAYLKVQKEYFKKDGLFSDLKALYKVKLSQREGSWAYTGSTKKIHSNTEDFQLRHFSDLRFEFQLPKVTTEYHGRERALSIEVNLLFDLQLDRGEIELKKKKGEIKFTSDHQLSEEQEKYIESQLASYEKGNYKIGYQFGTISGMDANFIIVNEL
ncbi:hypothetical protein [Mesonia sp. K4-1]|uniref:hypothetical protein n=1 Tax=Mesonia sp. K4-1 TaxID=2602760 RepID=UPI0021055085|nr:hypothetical protein [Mesonia sp. K4-1]